MSLDSMAGTTVVARLTLKFSVTPAAADEAVKTKVPLVKGDEAKVTVVPDTVPVKTSLVPSSNVKVAEAVAALAAITI
jgi:hypothetical protein